MTGIVMVLRDVSQQREIDRMKSDFISLRLARAANAPYLDKGIRRNNALTTRI